MKKTFILIVALNLALCVLVVTACASKDEAQITTNLQRQVLMYAQKVKFKQNGENGVFVLSYINPALKDEEDKDIFVLAVTPKEAKIQHLRAFMDDEEATIAPLSEDDRLQRYLVSGNYVSYYKFEFPFKDASLVVVKLCLGAECFELNFQKYPKSLYYRLVNANTPYNLPALF